MSTAAVFTDSRIVLGALGRVAYFGRYPDDAQGVAAVESCAGILGPIAPAAQPAANDERFAR